MLNLTMSVEKMVETTEMGSRRRVMAEKLYVPFWSRVMEAASRFWRTRRACQCQMVVLAERTATKERGVRSDTDRALPPAPNLLHCPSANDHLLD